MTKPEVPPEATKPRDHAQFCKPAKPHCTECGGDHEPSGARSDCIRHWKQRAIAATELVEWARTLLASGTPGKLLSEQQSQEWCFGFGKWFAESHQIPLLSHDWGCAKQLNDWLASGIYRVIMHRHNDTFRAADESERKLVEADTIPSLADQLCGWPENAKSY